MTGWLALVAFIAVQRLVELAWAARNTARLRAAGALEAGVRHYPLFVLLHGSWLVALAVIVPADAAIDVPLLGLFAVLQGTRLWIITTLGRFWTTRVLSLPGAPLIRRGPYRLLRHPNYFIVALEIPLVPLIAGAWQVALVFGIPNIALLAWRIRIEERTLAPRREMPS
jgi:methyltransferase